jgi:hypothetical protein
VVSGRNGTLEWRIVFLRCVFFVLVSGNLSGFLISSHGLRFCHLFCLLSLWRPSKMLSATVNVGFLTGFSVGSKHCCLRMTLWFFVGQS